jgi:hypothetical protein
MRGCWFVNPESLFAYGFTTTTYGFINEKAIIAVKGKQPFLNLDKTDFPKSFSSDDYFNLKEEDRVNDYYYEVYFSGRTDPFFITAEKFEPILVKGL